MTDTPPDPRPDAGLTDLAANRQMPDHARLTITLGELRATLDARPSGDEALRAAAHEYLFAAELWMRGVPLTDGESRDLWKRVKNADADLRAALAAPVSPSPKIDIEETLFVAIPEHIWQGDRNTITQRRRELAHRLAEALERESSND